MKGVSVPHPQCSGRSSHLLPLMVQELKGTSPVFPWDGPEGLP